MTQDTNNEAARPYGAYSPDQNDEILVEQVRLWTKERDRLQDLIAAATASQSSTAGAAKGGETCTMPRSEFANGEYAPAVPEGVDTPEFRELLGDFGDARMVADKEIRSRDLIAHIDGLLAQQREAGRRETAAAYDEVLAEKRQLVRELDVLLNGEEGAAKSPSLVDIVTQVRSQGIALSRQPAGEGLTDVQAWHMYEAAVEAVGRADSSREYAIKLVRAILSAPVAAVPQVDELANHEHAVIAMLPEILDRLEAAHIAGLARPDESGRDYAIRIMREWDLPDATAVPPSKVGEDDKRDAGMPVEQEPKYGIRDNRLYNRASGEFIPADEPVFIFRARDVHAAPAIAEYMLRLGPGDHREAVEQRMRDFSNFESTNPHRMKEPDTDAARAILAQQAKKGEKQ